LANLRSVTIESLVAGTVGAIAMMPAGFLFTELGMRVGHYGPKFAALYLSAPGELALFVQHMVLGWISAIPLVLTPLHSVSYSTLILWGTVYGTFYYVVVNSLAMPLYFGDELPWNLGWSVVYPSLVVHIIFGVAVAYTVRYLRDRSTV